MYKITVNGDRVFDDFTLNGNNYIAEEVIDNDAFEGLKSVVILNKETGETEEINDAVLLANNVFDGVSWLVFGQKSAEQKEIEEQRQTIIDLELALTEVYEMILGGD